MAEMKPIVQILLLFSLLLNPLGLTTAAETRDHREIAIAEETIMAVLVASSYDKSRYRCTQNAYACVGADPAELSLALLAGKRSERASDSFGKLVRFKLDAGLASDFHCYAFAKHAQLERHMKKIRPPQLAKECRQEVEAYVASAGQKFAGYDRNLVCEDAEGISRKIAEIQQAWKARKTCSPIDF